MKLRVSLLGLCCGLILWPLPASALVMFGTLKPDQVQLPPGATNLPWIEQAVRLQPHLEGHYMDAPTWWDGHFSSTYYYEGDEGALRQLIELLALAEYEHATVLVVEDEGWEDGNRLHQRTEPLPYDWELSISETTIRNELAGQTLLPTANQVVVRLTVYLGDRLDRQQFVVPSHLEPPILFRDDEPVDADLAVRLAHQPSPDVSPPPVNALHAIVRARRSL